MSTTTVKLLCALLGLATSMAAWSLLGDAEFRPTVLVLLVVGLVTVVLVSRTAVRWRAGLFYLWAGVLVGGLGQWAAHAIRFPDDPYSMQFNLTLSLAVVAFAALVIAIGFLLGAVPLHFLGRRRG